MLMAIGLTVEPGSTVKPLAILAGLDYGTIQPDSIVDTSPGWMRVGGSLVQDTRNLTQITYQMQLHISVATVQLPICLSLAQLLSR